MACKHMIFKADVDVARLSKEEGGQITGYSADIRISCQQCGLPFRFIGVPASVKETEEGLEFTPARNEPRVSVDACELRAPIEPAHVHEILGKPVVAGNA